MPSRRQERVARRLVQEASEAIRSLKDPRIGFVTVTGATVTPDLRDAQIKVSVLGDEAEQQATLEALQHSRNHIQSLLASRLSFKTTPRILFTYDRSIQRADEMARLIAEARATDPHPGPLVDEDCGKDAAEESGSDRG